ncbi:MAG TPA: PAS domain-containing protein [Cyclobacteriaceae bacterium]|jgi:PAS domain-containing protein|nr:PAS domain-containing protein [Cyclobacteriaceae bacterium]
MSSQKDISSILISEQAIQQVLPSILVDTIVLDEDYKIIAASENVLDYTGYTNDELKNKPINFLSGGNEELFTLLKSNLAAGYFCEKRGRMLTKGNNWISVSLTGFYMGLISDLNGLIALKIKNLDKHDNINKQLHLKNLLDPLTSLRSLVNLIKERKNNDELESLIDMMTERTNKLDEHLSQLSYLPCGETSSSDAK